jgi:predicted patatin/cPLA2 family phospholipase
MATTQQGIGIRLSSGPAVDAILASTAIPGVFPAVNINGEPLMDGAVAANTQRTTEESDRPNFTCDHADDCLAAHL